MSQDARVTQAQYWKTWQDEMNKLNHEIFFNTDAGKLWLKMTEERHFYAPVADPNVDVSFAHFNEGRNNFIRGISTSAYAAMQPQQSQQVKQDINHERLHEEDGQI